VVVDGTGERPPVVARGPALTEREQRVVTLLVARSAKSESDPEASTRSGMPVMREPSRTTTPEATRLRELCASYGGRVDFVAGGSVLVTLSGAHTPTQQALQATRLARAMAQAMPDTAVAVATGRAVITEKLPLGEVIERATRLLEGASEPGVQVDDVTTGLLGGRLSEADGSEGGPIVARRLLGRPVVCLGRERELTTLTALFDECCAELTSNVVLVTGPAGIGKSLVCDELLTRLRVREEPPEVWTGRGDPLGARAPFGMVADALRRAAGILEGEPLDAKREKLRVLAGRHVAGGEVPRVAAFLGEMMDVPFSDDGTLPLYAARRDPTLMGDQIRRAFEDIVRAAAAARPLLFVLDDLHWGDLPSVQLLDRALRHARGAPLLVVALGRPEVREVFPDLWQARDMQEIRLGGLHRRHCVELVQRALGEVPAATVDRVVERAAGNPFYVEELVRAHSEGRTERLPETVLAILQARLEALDPEARRVLRAASVFGATFWRGGVLALLGGETEARWLDPWLGTLCERELCERRPGCRFHGDNEIELGFRHALVREAAYATLTDADRALGHRLAGDWLETAGERNPAVLAEHFERGDEPLRARAALRRAAAQALEGHDFDEVVRRAERAVRFGATGAELGELRLLEAEAQRWLGRFDTARNGALEACELLAPGDARWYRAIDEWLTATGRLGEFDAVPAMAARARAATPQPAAASARLACLCSAARVFFHAGRYDDADALLAEASAAATVEVDARDLAELERLRGARARHVGDLAGDLAGYRAALAAFERAGDDRNACNARVSVGFAWVEVGDLAKAHAELAAALAGAERMGLSTIATRARQNLGLVLHAQGELDGAVCMLERAIVESQEQRNVRFEAWTRVYLARVLRDAGRLKDAEAEGRRAAEQLKVTPPARGGALAALSRVLLAAGDTAAALEAACEAMAILESYGGIEEFEPLVRLALAEALDATGDRAGARAAIAEAGRRLADQAQSLAPELRDAFLHAAPDNARIAALAAAWDAASGL
jgi:eukaryotic-like serine/threonine-protein kinase